MKLQRPKWSSSWFHASVIWKSIFSRHSLNRQQAVPFKKNLRLAGASRTLPETVRVEPSLKLTVCPWKSTVGRCNFLPGWPIFTGKPLLSGNVIRANKPEHPRHYELWENWIANLQSCWNHDLKNNIYSVSPFLQSQLINSPRWSSL